MTFLLKKNIKRFRARIHALNFKTVLTPRDGTRILLYHSIGGSPRDHKLAVRLSPEEFKKELEFLHGCGYRTCTISELIGNELKQESEKCVALTFDDGYKDNITVAAPIIKRLGMNATFFITTSYIDGRYQKKWANGTPREYMDWDDVLNLSEMGFEIGSHMIHHIDLATIDENELRFELEESRKLIYKNIKKEAKVLSYPYGGVDVKVITLAKEIGYTGGCSSIYGVNYSDTDRYILKRTEIDGYDTMEDFRHKLYGYYD